MVPLREHTTQCKCNDRAKAQQLNKALICRQQRVDNNYVALLDVSHHLHDAVRLFLCHFQSIVYDMLMKWEPESDTVSWCEASLTTSGMLVLKGVPTGPEKSAWQLWHQWPDRWSPSCPVTSQSMIPSLVLKAVTLCSDPAARKLNFQAISRVVVLNHTRGDGGGCPSELDYTPWDF